MKSSNKILFLLLIAGVALCIIQVWLPKYFLTGDGPCHVYNSEIVNDLWRNKDKAFFSRYFTLQYQANPNWLSTFIMASLMFLVNGIIAEKIFLTMYILVFLSGFYRLLEKVSGNISNWELVIFVFVFSHTLCLGFYNFSFGIALYFWLVWSWINFLEKITVRNTLVFFLISLLLFFTHLLPFAFGVVTCASLILSYSIAGADGKQRGVRYFIKYAVWLTALLSPLFLLTKLFIGNQNGLQLQMVHHLDMLRIKHLIQFITLINITHQEAFFAEVTGIILLLLFFICVVVRLKNGFRPHRYDGFVLSLLFCSFIYLFCSEYVLGNIMLITIRTQPFVFILLTCCISYMGGSATVKKVCGLLLFGCFLAMSGYRILYRSIASRGEEDMMLAWKYIKPYSVVLPLNFSPNGKDEKGRYISDRNQVFGHASQYLGLGKPLIVLDNFEATYGYFPIVWTDSANPYDHLSKYEGMDGIPPFAAIDAYKQASGVTINYILMWCYDSSYLQKGHFREFYTNINAAYHTVYVSPSKRTVLFEKNE